MVKMPVPYTLAEAEPEMVPNRAEAKMAALRVAGEVAGQIHEDGAHAGLFEEGAEHDEAEQR